MVDETYTPEPGEAWAENQLLPAEIILLAAARTGGVAHISDYKPTFLVPWVWEEKHQIRAEFLRHMLIHPNTHQIDPKGFEVIGAYLTGTLNLENLKIAHRLGFIACWFNAIPLLIGARSRTLAFYTCRLPGLTADGLQVEGSLFLRKSLFEGEVRLLGINVKVAVSCTGTKFMHKGENAFNADGLHVNNGLFLSDTTVTGATRLVGADVQGNVTCSNASFIHVGGDAFNADGLHVVGSLLLNDITVTGAARLGGAEVSGGLDCTRATFINPGGDAFSAQRLTVTGRLFFEKFNTPPVGTVDFAHARVGDWVDDESVWPEEGTLILDGLVYDNLPRHYDAATRRRWLARQPKTNVQREPAFWPQPYEQLIKVLKAAGHERDARLIAIAKQGALREYLHRNATTKKKDAQGNELTTYVKCDQRYLRRSWLWFTGLTIGYGYESWRATYFLFGVLGFGLFAFLLLDLNGLMEPAKERIYTHACYTDKTDCPHWVEVNHNAVNGDPRYVPPDYPDFNSFIYSLDVLLPIVDMKLESHWMPGSRGFWGTLGRVYFWLHIALGWIFTTIAVVGFTGLVKQDKD